MVLHTVFCYGLYYSKNLSWIVEYFSPIRKKGISKAIWVCGGILALMEIGRFVPSMIENNYTLAMTVDKLMSVTHSYLVIQVFVEPIVTTAHRYLTIFKRNSET